MIRRAVALLVAVAVALPLAGCWSRVEVNDLAIVSMMAIDRTEQGQLKVWLHVVVPAQAGGAPGITGGGGGPRGSPFITLSARGDTVLEASKLIQLQLPRRIFWAHMRVILIGERLGRAGVRRVLDFLTRHREMRLTNYVLMVRGGVTDLMAAQVDLEKFPVEYLREISRSRIGTVVTVGDFAKALAARGMDPVMGVAEVVPPSPGAPAPQRSGLKLNGTALFRDDKLVGFSDEHTTRGLLWLKGEVHLGVITVEIPRAPGHVAVEWVSSRVKRRVRVERGQIVFYIRANTEGDVSENSANLDLSDPKALQAINGQMNREIRERMEEALKQMQELGTDSAGLGEFLHQRMPAVWKRVEQKWHRQEFRRVKVVIEVDAHVRRTGLSSKPRGVKEEELVK
ncbi:MAG TPA: Ger(x)C family spore germination protein [Symbiobacteriaceae bacterium]|jgi:spore germination protein KC